MDPCHRRPWAGSGVLAAAVVCALSALLVLCRAQDSLQHINTRAVALDDASLMPFSYGHAHDDAALHLRSMLGTANSSKASCSEQALGAPVTLFVPSPLARRSLPLLVAFQPGSSSSTPSRQERSAYQR
jgi:hypothetical protein